MEKTTNIKIIFIEKGDITQRCKLCKHKVKSWILVDKIPEATHICFWLHLSITRDSMWGRRVFWGPGIKVCCVEEFGRQQGKGSPCVFLGLLSCWIGAFCVCLTGWRSPSWIGWVTVLFCWKVAFWRSISLLLVSVKNKLLWGRIQLNVFLRPNICTFVSLMYFSGDIWC